MNKTVTWKQYEQWLSAHILSPIPSQIPAPGPLDFVTDTRTLKAGEWFVPLKGENFDGHEFIEEAMRKHVAGFLTEKEIKNNYPSIRVKNTLNSLHAIATGWRSTYLSNCQFVALTGSVGKTTVKTMVNLMLSHVAPTYCTPGNQNTEFAIPKSLLQMTEQYRFGVFEFGARHPGDIAFLTNTVKPNVSACLNIASAHIGMFGSRDAILKTKLEIIAQAPNDTKGVVLHDDPVLLEEARKFKKELITFGFHPEANVVVLSSQKTNKGFEISLKVNGKMATILLADYHESYPINIAAALAIGNALGLTFEECKKGLSLFSGIKGRYKIHTNPSGLIVIDDTYNASPESMKAGLKTVQTSFPTRKKILILGDMRELGDIATDAHLSLVPYCLALKPEVLITVGEISKIISDSVLDEKEGKPHTVYHFLTVDSLLKELPKLSKLGDLIYLKGSNAIQLFRAVDSILEEDLKRS